MNMRLKVIVGLVFLNSIVLFAQEKITKHTIVKGETISSIAEKYEVKQSAIFKLNPNAKNLLKLNSVLLIPIASTKNTTVKTKSTLNQATKEHEVQAKETLYGIAKQYGISVKELNQINPSLATAELKIGQKINIPAAAIANEIANVVITKQIPTNIEPAKESKIESEALQSSHSFVWEVVAKETKYSITKKYGITIKEFDKANPSLGVKALRVGQKVVIPGVDSPRPEMVVASLGTSSVSEAASKNMVPTQISVTKTQETITAPIQNSPTSIQTITREVLAKETKYAIAKEYGITVKELENQNPAIKNGLPVGYKLSILYQIIADNSEVVAVELNDKETKIESSKIDFNSPIKPAFSHDFLDQLIAQASENIGTRYRTGGTTKSGFDCSGLMCTTFGAFDIKLPRTSREQSSMGTKVNTEEAQKGDLIFFKTNGRSQINHVGMVVEVCEGEIKFIHSSVSNGVIISSTKEKYYEKNFSQINRVLQ
jgi:cell wall-associated NlpC family hydrolase